MVEEKGFIDYQLYFVGNSYGAYKNLSLAKKFPQTAKFLGINTSYIDVDELIDKLRDLQDIKKHLFVGLKIKTVWLMLSH